MLSPGELTYHCFNARINPSSSTKRLPNPLSHAIPHATRAIQGSRMVYFSYNHICDLTNLVSLDIVRQLLPQPVRTGPGNRCLGPPQAGT